MAEIEELIEHSQKEGVTLILDGGRDSDLFNSGNKYAFEPNDRILTVVLSNLTEDDQVKLLPVVKEHFANGCIILNASQDKILSSYTEYTSAEDSDRKLLTFFERIISSDDLMALKMSLFMRYRANTGEKIHTYKSAIKERFGSRGVNISNLCSAGYFEEFMRMYNQSSPEEFQRYYELAVGVRAVALFIHSGMTTEQIETEFNRKIYNAINYRIKHFKIHGYGADNVRMIKEFINTRQTDDDEFIIIKIHENTSPPSIVYDIQLTI